MKYQTGVVTGVETEELSRHEMSFLTIPSEHTNVIQVDVFSEVKVTLRRYIRYLPLNTSPTIILYLI